MTPKAILSADLETWKRELWTEIERLRTLAAIPEPRLESGLPLVGAALSAVRTFVHRLFGKWYVRPFLDRQNGYNLALAETFEDWGRKTLDLASRIAAAETLDAADLKAWENADVPDRAGFSAQKEILADAKQSPDLSIQTPFHWRHLGSVWMSLFTLALAGEALAGRPGDLVLDYASGSGWVAEALNRLGIRTVSLDLSEEMLRNGGLRFAADTRLNRLTRASFVCGDALKLPFAAESFEGLICLNAFHHLPDFQAAFAEIHRVLKPGGRAVFSEPGAWHARTPLSNLRMREEGVLEKNVPLPLVRRLAGEAGFSRMRIVPLLDPEFYAVDYTDGPEDERALAALWRATTLRFSQERAFFILVKGPDRPPDTRDPLRRIASGLSARIEIRTSSPSVRRGTVFTDRVAVFNTGSVVWKAARAPMGGHVTVGVKICAPDGTVLRDDLGRTLLAADVLPGEKAEVDLSIPADLAPGSYLLKYDPVIEEISWFEQTGSTPAVRPLMIVPEDALTT